MSIPAHVMRVSASSFGKKALCVVLSIAMFATMGAGLAQAAPPPPAGGLAIPVAGVLAGGGSFVGSFNLQNFAVVDNQLVAVGTLTGTLTNAVGTVLGTIVQTISIPVTPGQSSCQILHLTLGPLDLNLLGLAVHLNQIVLDITAQPGAGNLLGNLLCSVAHLLDTNGPLNALAHLLDQILGQL